MRIEKLVGSEDIAIDVSSAWEKGELYGQLNFLNPKNQKNVI